MFDVWKNVLAEVEQAIPRSAFATWFKDVSLASIENGVVTIKTPNVFKEGQIRKKYDSVIRDALTHNDVKFTDVQYIVSAEQRVKPRSREISREEIISAPIHTKPDMPARRTSGGASSKFNSGLNPNYTMDNFVIGSNNDWAASVAQAIIKDPGGRYNPFYLYGGPGLGKTHLVQAVGNGLLALHPNLNVAYVPTNSFYNEFISALGAKQANSFTKKYQNVDVLIIDDIQMIMGKEATQNAFFDIFNELQQHGKQIIVTSDRLPAQLKSLDERLSSRLASGGAYDIQLPKFEDKCAILRMKAEYDGVEIEDEAIEYIANLVNTNVRDLEGEYKKILAFAEFKGITPLEVINGGLVSGGSATRRSIVSPRKVVDTVANCLNLTTKEMCGKSRVAHIKTARQIAMYLLSEELGMSTTKIALEVGVKDHTTVMHGVKKIREDIKNDFALREQVASIREELYV
ncbi:chromosomal replication initiator protein DnaA [Candidatus Saccharibacteria bacterium]|nr:chromosomal replication initiator protein DnaA [Candidatus Saccharibacteria bacterium]